MSRRTKKLTSPALVIALGFWLTASALGQDHRFSETQLRAGEEAVRARRFPDAIDHFRIAAFGLLDRPELLSETLVRLALAQQAARRPKDLTATVERFLDLERRFGSFATAALEPDTRAAFRRLLDVTVARQVLAEIPSLSSWSPGAAGGSIRSGVSEAGTPIGRSGDGPRPTPPPTRINPPRRTHGAGLQQFRLPRARPSTRFELPTHP